MSKVSRATKNASDFTVAELKDILKSLGQSTGGTKAELIGKLTALDPEGAWMEASLGEGENDDGRTSDFHGGDDGSGSDERARHRLTPTKPGASADGTMQREMELMRKEKELMQRELDLARYEIELLRRNTENAPAPVQRREVSPSIPSRANVSIIAELLSYFDGGADTYDKWSKQVGLLKTTYGLDDNTTRVLIGSRLRGKALDWFHSKSEHIELPINRLLEELKAMFSHRRSKVAMRKQFEDRTWRRGEAFSEYLHDKVILANRVPVPDDEILDYVIDGISDPALRDQARIQRFGSTIALLEAFEKITIQPRGQPNGASGGRFDDRSFRFQKIDGKEAQSSDRCCYNCGQRGHVSAKCPSKSRGVKCFRCSEFGHIAAKCSKNQSATREANTAESVGGVGQAAQKKCCKGVSLFGCDVAALIDSGSDLTLMREQSYVEVGAPPLQGDETRFRDIGSGIGGTLDRSCSEVGIDGHSYPMTVHVVADPLISHDLLIGNDFLDTVETNIKKGKITISKLKDDITCDSELPEIFMIDDVREANETDVTCIVNDEYRWDVERMIENYKPIATRAVDVSMKLILKDDEPVYQRPRRLSASEKEVVNARIDEWLHNGIIRPSLSEYASPIVLVKKKMDRLGCALITG